MKRKKRILSVFITMMTLMIMLLPGSEAGAATSASDFRMEGSTLVKYRGTEKNVTIPSTVEAIGASAFEENTNVELVVVPNSVKRIDSYAFWGCDNLDTIVLGTGLSEVGDYTFAKCTGLEQISIPSNVTSIGAQAFGDCVNLTDISIPKETTSIDESAFDGCSKVTIHCDEGSYAAEYAEQFYERQKNMPGYGEEPEEGSDGTPGETPGGTSGGTQDQDSSGTVQDPGVSQPDSSAVPGELIGSTQIVGNQAVLIVNNTRLHVYEKEQKPAVSADVDPFAPNWDGKISKYRIVDGKTVADQAYYRNAGLDSLALEEGIEEIGEFAFARSSLYAAALPEGVKHIGYGAFYHCDQLAAVTLPESVMCVEPKAFSNTLWMKSFLEGEHTAEDNAFLITGGVLMAYGGNAAEVTIPEGVRVIAGEAFQNHTEIEKVSLPDTVQVVGEAAFEGCTALGQIVLGTGVKEIKDRAFLGNTLPEITLPESVEKVGLQAFGNTMIHYQGAEAAYTYETSATRLSNRAYRGISDQGEEMAGVTVEGLAEAFGGTAEDIFRTGQSALTEADRAYTLTVSQPGDTAEMEKAFGRVFQTELPEEMVFYDLELTDESGILLKKLGQQTLTVVLPVPEQLAGGQLRLFALDGNGQLETLETETVEIGDVHAFRFETNYLSMIGVCSVNQQ